jgi:hypothetical protein
MSGTHNLEGLKTQALTCIEAAYDKGYKSGLNDGNINDGTFAAKVKEAYDNGLNDAWECAKKIVTDTGLNYEELGEIFGYTSMDTIFGNFSASEAVTKVKEYEDEQKKPDDEIHVGDEVYYMHDKNVKKIVLGITDFGNFAVLSQNGNFGVFSKCELYKTGRNYPIMEILKKLNQLNESEE